MKTLSDLKQSVLIPTSSSLDELLGGGYKEKGAISSILWATRLWKDKHVLKYYMQNY